MAEMNGVGVGVGTTEEEEKEVLLSPSTKASLIRDEENSSSSNNKIPQEEESKHLSVFGVLKHLMESIFFADSNENNMSMSEKGKLIKKSLVEASPLFHEAILNTRRDLLLWTRRGTPLRSLLVVTVGIVTLLALTGMLVFMLFFIAATVNAIVISLLISMVAVGGGLAIFFFCLAAFYVAMLFIAAFVTFTITISTIIAATVAAGWIGFIWMAWLAVSKCASIAKHYLGQADKPANVSDEAGSTFLKSQ